MNENWRAVVGYEGLYEVSDQGRVRSLKFGKMRILKSGKAGAGYLFVGLCKDGKGKHMYVHRLVAEAFIQNPNNLETVNHKDEVKTNNAASNLEWMSRKDNNNYGTHNKKVSKALLGIHRSEETRKKMSIAKRGTKFWNNGEKCIRAKKCPKGFKAGLLRKGSK